MGSIRGFPHQSINPSTHQSINARPLQKETRCTRDYLLIKHSISNTRTRFLSKSFPWDPPLGEHGSSLLERQPVSAENPRVSQALSSGPQRAREASRVGEVERQTVPPAPSPMGRVSADRRFQASRSRQQDRHRLPRQTLTDCYTTRKSKPAQKYITGDSQLYRSLLSAEYMGIDIFRRNPSGGKLYASGADAPSARIFHIECFFTPVDKHRPPTQHTTNSTRMT